MWYGKSGSAQVRLDVSMNVFKVALRVWLIFYSLSLPFRYGVNTVRLDRGGGSMSPYWRMVLSPVAYSFCGLSV